MSDNGASVFHNSIANGIDNIKSKLEEDKDYQTIIRDIERAVFV